MNKFELLQNDLINEKQEFSHFSILTAWLPARRVIVTPLLMILFFILVGCGNYSEAIITKPAASPTPASTAVPEFQKGVAYTSWWHGEYSSPESDRVLAEMIKPMGVTWITVLVTCFQDNITSTEIQCLPDKNTPTDEDVAHVIRTAHALGLKVMLKPHIDLLNDDGHWRGQIGYGSDEAAWDAWFASYDKFITHYAALAQENKADYFAVGTELGGTSQRELQWRAVIKNVKTLYTGPLTYAANWGEAFDVNWWNALDSIGVDAYYPLTEIDHPSLAQLKEAWKPIVARLGQLSQRWQRPIILTEVGYRSVEGANRFVDVQNGVTKIDLQGQADCYQAVFEAFAGQPWWRGVFWWNWAATDEQGGPSDNDFTANNKPAENILRAYYGAAPRAIAGP